MKVKDNISMFLKFKHLTKDFQFFNILGVSVGIVDNDMYSLGLYICTYTIDLTFYNNVRERVVTVKGKDK